MSNSNLWKYSTPEKCNDFILSLKLFGHTPLTDKQQIQYVYSMANQLEKHYRLYKIPKRNGKTRRIMSPDSFLKMAQRNILKNLLSHRTCSIYGTAYQKGKTLRDNVVPHVNQPQILKLDIEDFFGSITFPMVARAAFPSIYFPPAVVGLLTNICCYDDCLPQGAPTSPTISNLVMKPFDDYIGKWCFERKINYTRYCDDLTFSGEFDYKAVKNKVQSFLNEMGFSLNKRKTTLVRNGSQQNVTGIVVNTKPQVSKKYRNQLRQEVYYCQKFGVASHLKYKKEWKNLTFGKETVEHYLKTLMGKIDFVLQVNPQDKDFFEFKQTVKKWILNNQINEE